MTTTVPEVSTADRALDLLNQRYVQASLKSMLEIDAFACEIVGGLQDAFDRQELVQHDFMGVDTSNLCEHELAEYIRWNTLAMQAEMIELMDCVQWKPWAQNQGKIKVDRDKLLDEAADVWCFFMNILLALKITPADLIRQHHLKTMVNIYRQLDGYDTWDKSKKNYLQTFFAFNGPGPWVCEFCGELVMLDSLNVHHRDHDHDNNSGTNLVASHRLCHQEYHMKNGRGEIMRTSSAKAWTAERRKKMSDGIKNSKRFMCPSCGKETIRGGPTVRHLMKCGVPEDQWPDPVSRRTTRTDAEITAAQIANTDRTPTMCECGAGPFRGLGGLKIHQKIGNRCASKHKVVSTT